MDANGVAWLRTLIQLAKQPCNPFAPAD